MVDVRSAREGFADALNRPRLVAALSAILARGGHGAQGEWFLEDLPLRLCCHGRKWDLQFMSNPDLFFRWFERVETVDPYDEDHVCGSEGPVDRRNLEELHRAFENVRHVMRRTRFVAGTTRRKLLALVRG
jgi:hypothetical protein